ncbi:MAG TPA: type II secretion system protein [Blastocatellia bacterium]|nr:type II secretion system protein [Blastocatellia bacterium]HMX25536.1 type II secretion system protein [Blastocatellia bacterium]HMY74924.1 type II secretion system protein [Blastocatellia bacterium]HMZ21345.1 type II secretion system protein [Blastocatellia bacterium]HNG30164.1 type II secretion system protein [Blastocatellia bacterium]
MVNTSLTKRKSSQRRPLETGFTLLELIITLAILSILSLGTIPIARNLIRHERELELKRTLREMRKAIDTYHRDCDAGKIGMLDRKPNDGCYPLTLEILVEGIPKAAPGGIAASGEMLRYLRRIPKDPMTGRDDWKLRSVQDDPDSGSWGGENVYNVYSSSQQLALDGKTYYKDW